MQEPKIHSRLNPTLPDDHWLAQQGISVMRVGAGEVYRNLGQVADAVILRAHELIDKR